MLAGHGEKEFQSSISGPFRKCYFGTSMTADTEFCTSHTITHWSPLKEKVPLQAMVSAWASWGYSSIQNTLTILQQDVLLLRPAIVVQESPVSLDQFHFLILNGCLLSKPPAFCQGQVLIGFIYFPITEEMKDMLQADLQPKKSKPQYFKLKLWDSQRHSKALHTCAEKEEIYWYA